MLSDFTSMIFPPEGQRLWALNEQLAVLGGVRGRDYDLAQSGGRYGYRASDALYAKWKE